MNLRGWTATCLIGAGAVVFFFPSIVQSIWESWTGNPDDERNAAEEDAARLRERTEHFTARASGDSFAKRFANGRDPSA